MLKPMLVTVLDVGQGEGLEPEQVGDSLAK
jgi:hypothetical protein